MNRVLCEQLMSMIGLSALWFFWYYLWKPQRIDAFRQKLFALRADLFRLGADGVVPFDHPAYARLRLLINGVIRFAHRANFPEVLVIAISSDDRAPNALAEWQKSTDTLPENARNEVRAIYEAVSDAFVKHIVGGSLVLNLYIGFRVMLSIAKAIILALVGRRKLREFTVQSARAKVDRESLYVTKRTNLIEARVLQDELKRVHQDERRGNAEHRHAYAH